MLTEPARNHQLLIVRFLSGQDGATKFERNFFDEWPRRYRPNLTDREFEILNELFWAAEDFVADLKLRDSPEDLDEDQLRAAATRALQALHALDAEQQG